MRSSFGTFRGVRTSIVMASVNGLWCASIYNRDFDFDNLERGEMDIYYRSEVSHSDYDIIRNDAEAVAVRLEMLVDAMGCY